MARIMVTDATVFRPVETPKAVLDKGVDRDAEGSNKLSLLAKGLGLADAAAKSPAIGALLAGLGRVGSRLTPPEEDTGLQPDEGATREMLRRQAASALMAREAAKSAAGAAKGAADGVAPTPAPESPAKAEPATPAMGAVREGMARVAVPAALATPAKASDTDAVKAFKAGVSGVDTTLPAPAAMQSQRKFKRTSDPGVILAMASRANTPEAQQEVMEMAADAEVYGTSLADMVTGQSKLKFLKDVRSAFPKFDALEGLKAENIRSQIGSRARMGDLAEIRTKEQIAQNIRRLEFDQRKLEQQAEALKKKIAASARQGQLNRSLQRELQAKREEAAMKAAERKRDMEALEGVQGVVATEEPSLSPDSPEAMELAAARAEAAKLAADELAAEQRQQAGIDLPRTPEEQKEIDKKSKRIEQRINKAVAALSKKQSEIDKAKAERAKKLAPLFPGAGSDASIMQVFEAAGRGIGRVEPR